MRLPPATASPAPFRFEHTSVVAASPAQVWARVSTMTGVNAELRPIAHMTYPSEADVLDPASIPIGRPAFRSWILLFGVLPIDLHNLTLLRFEPGRGFFESSTSLMQRHWIHERTLDAVDGGCRVTDRVQFEPRLPLVGRLLLPIFRHVFAHRHQQLRRAFGDVAAT